VGAAAIAGIDACAVEPRRLTVSTHSVGGSGSSVRLVQLSDLHLRHSTRRAERVAETVAALRPGLIAITGDAIDDARQFGLLESFLDMLDTRVPKIGKSRYRSASDRIRKAGL
jgi:predicted MPP superfamily phosphohydrolase